MAVEVNKRKRKHTEDNSQDDEGAKVVPKKQSKKSLTPKKEKKPKKEHHVTQDEEHLDDSQQDSGFDAEEKYIKFSKDFKMLEFRTKLRGVNFITELRHFLYICQSRPKMVGKYIEKRGKPLELAEALERVDKTNVLHMSYICDALQMVIMEILSHQRSHMESAVSASRYFLKTHGPILELLLKSVQLNHRKVALKLLTAIVCVEPQLGRQVLSSYDILSNVKNITQFLSHSQFELQQYQEKQYQRYNKSNDNFETVRKCFIHFVLSYLVDGNTLLTRNILDRGSLIRALASGLLYDDSVTVCVVLSTLKKFVLECPEISKTKKIHVFDLECCKSFVQLYDWRGPNVYAEKYSGKMGTEKQLTAMDMENLINPQEKDAVSKSVHEFLLVLLTSRKFGITFDTIKFFRQKHNTIQGQIMGFIQFPWANERKTDLVMKILESCPDLSRNTVRNFAGIINPLRTAQRFWIPACEFLTKIISTCHPRLLKGALDKITLTDFSFLIKDICLPIESLVHINGNKILLNKNYQQRLAINHLLLAMFKQYTNYMQIIMQREQNKGSNSLRRFKFDILNHLLMNFPTMENILQSLNISIQFKQSEEVDVLAHLDVALDLILIVCQENRTFVNKTTVILDYLEILRPLYAYDEQPDGEGVNKEGVELNKSNIKLEMKAIKTILLLFPKALEPQKERFSSVLTSFIKAFVYGEPEISHEAGTLLRGIFKNTGIFESGELEIDLWLEALKFFDAATVNVATQVFNEVLKVTKVDVETPKTLETTTNTENMQTLFDNIEKGLSVQAYVESLSISKLMPLIYKGVEIEPPFSKYLEIVCFLMFHYYPSADYVVQLYDKHFKTMKPYMENWLSQKQYKFKDIFIDHKSAKLIPRLIDVQSLVLYGNKEFEQIFESKSQDDVYDVEFKGNMKKLSTLLQNERMIMIYIQHVLFEINQLQEKQMLTKDQANKSAEFINNCMEMLKKCQTKQEFLADEQVSIDTETFGNKLLKYIYGVKLQSIKSNDLFNATKGNDNYINYLLFLQNLTDYCNKLDNFDIYSENFKLKMVKAVAISLNTKEETEQNSENLEEFINLIKVFNLSSEHCLDILNLLSENLTYKDFFLVNINNQKSIYYSLMVCILQRLSDLKKSVKCEQFIKRFSKIYSNFFKKLQGDFNIEALEEAFYNFLIINHQYIPKLEEKFFETFFKERKLSKSSIKLACLLFERTKKLEKIFLEHLEENMDKKELMYPLMELAFKNNLLIDSAVLQKIYQNYKNGFMRTIEKPLKAGVIYKEHVETSLKLIELCMPLTECRDFCNKQFKFEHIETYQLRTIYKIYEKAFNNVDVKLKSSVFVNYIMLQVQMLSLDIKMQKLNQEKLELIGYQLQLWFKYGWELNKKSDSKENSGEQEKEKEIEFSPDFSKLLKSQQWLQFCKSCLKSGMHISESDIESDSTDKFNGLLLKLLAFLTDNLYTDYSEESNETSGSNDCSQLYEMIFTHSKFHDLVLIKPHLSLVKCQVLHLLYILAKKSPSSLQETQIAVILGAYQAKLYDADRYCLALLNLYEYYDCGLSKYRPFIWGESAIAFYALKAADEERAKLTQQETSINQVMSLVDRQVCEYTIDNFPIWRKLDTLQQLPVVEFANPFNKPWLFGANQLEQKLELGLSVITENEMRLCPKRSEIFEQCYDPAFFVPLMSMCFSNESYAHPARPVQNGLLALTFAALSSQDKEMRQSAGCVQLRYRAHFENSKFFEKPLWIQTYENIQSGLNDLRNSWMKHKSNSGTPRVPYISGLFVAKTFNLTTDPTHLLYKQLTMYLRLKSSFNFQCIPEFNVLFYSPEVEHQEFRQFIVEVIKNGIKSSSDLFLLVSTNTFKVLMGFYGSTMSTLELNLQILSVFSTCVKIPASSKIMIDHIGIIPWLSSIVSSIEFYQFDVIEGLISIINNLWYSLKANEKEFHNFAHIILELHRLILQLLPLISPRISLTNFCKLMNILQKSCLQSTQYLALSSQQLTKIISCAEKHFGSLVLPLESIFENGGMGSSSPQVYCKELFGQQVDSKLIMALNSLRSYIITWWSAHNNDKENLLANNETVIEKSNDSSLVKC